MNRATVRLHVMWAITSIIFGCPTIAAAVTPVIPQLLIEASSDVTLNLSGSIVADEQPSSDDFDIPPIISTLPGVPSNADVVALSRDVDDDWLVVFDITISLPGAGGNVIATPQDVMRLSGGTYSLEYDGSANGLTAGVSIDAVSVHPTGLIMSFDVTTTINSVVVDDADLVLWDGAVHTLLFDSDAAGVPMSYDIDGVHYANVLDRFQMSFKTGGNIGGAIFADEDVVEYDVVSGDFTVALDSSVLHSEWAAGDLDALALDTDSDNDGLGDADENLLGTQPLNSDSDEDGLLDGVETNTGEFVDATDTGTDPLVKDTDGDGIEDGDEVANGTDPTDANDPVQEPIQIPSVPTLLMWLLALGLILMTNVFASKRVQVSAK